LVAGLIAGVTGLSYMQLVRRFPRAGGEAIYVSNGLGPFFGRLAGMGVVITGTISSAVVALAFGGYLRSLTGVPTTIGVLGIIALVVVVAALGVRESVLAAAAVTLIEVGTLVVVAIFGLPKLADGALVDTVLTQSGDGFVSPVLGGAVIAFFAFIGFEDIANMAEETVDPRRTAPRAIAWTLGISIVIYVLLASIAVVLPGRTEIVESDAPVAALFEQVGGRGSDVVSTVASLAMTNGILVQIVMASRVLFGMASERLLPGPLNGLGKVDAERRTPVRATLAVASVVCVLVVLVPLGRLARITSLFTLGVFTLVNLALYLIGRREASELRRWRYVGLVGAGLAAALAVWELAGLL
jgi:amino acid transporter